MTLKAALWLMTGGLGSLDRPFEGDSSRTSHPRSSLVLAASCLSMSAVKLSVISWPCTLTCCSIKRRVSSETPSLDFFSVPMAPDRTFLNDSLALWLNSLASLHRFSLCSRVTLRGTHAYECTRMMVPSTSGFSLRLLSLRARAAAAVTWGSIKARGGGASPTNLPRRHSPGEVRRLRFRLYSSFRLSRMAAMPSFTSSRLRMSCTSSVLIFTLPGCAFPLAGGWGRRTQEKHHYCA
uniref:Uncharacterized protein n=1 Tax=Paramormyrops kingsleyae TaxID=1676925 RepID=A0A3B3RSG8_9TELE